ncbi:AraC family transcriptional regulator [Thiocapsa bogorovii]|uniref:AraC family transcriptional regulator n=1 Tax=Thiocapsa bogorovii TaxID=521689 RepID=UPI001E298935|nr:AraC family transcriptional regulator [Thiocapsa bogorovii]UHD16541.1 AraC family transcriptional regulator [Thiocapsa bogorovii]
MTRGPDHYSVADDPGTPTTVVIHLGQHCCSPEGDSLAEHMTLGVRTWGNHPRGETLMLVGAYEATDDVSERLRRALPPLLSLNRDQRSTPLVSILCDEMGEDRPGQVAVLDRLLDLLLTAALRAWFARPEAMTPASSPPQADPMVGHALQLLREDPAYPWTLEGLARRLGVSRAALARRFHDAVGQPPMSFLTEWRLALAADRLSAPNATVGSVAARVGYSTPYALSSAFKRVRGISPRAHRARVMA